MAITEKYQACKNLEWLKILNKPCLLVRTKSAPKEFYTVKSDSNKLKSKIDRAILKRDHVLTFLVKIAEINGEFSGTNQFSKLC